MNLLTYIVISGFAMLILNIALDVRAIRNVLVKFSKSCPIELKSHTDIQISADDLRKVIEQERKEKKSNES